MTDKIPDLLESFARLVAFPTVSSTDPAYDMSNRALVECLANWLEDLQFDVDLLPVPRAAGSDQEKLNLVAKRGEGEAGLVLSGHTDTVPCNADAWDSDPYVLTQRDGKLYGLGTDDIKCLFPLVLQAVQAFEPKHFKQPLFVLATADEESSMAGARALRDAGVKLGAHALIGEPTGLKPVIKHKGILIEKIVLLGQSGHSSDPGLGKNALEGMNRVINRLLAWREELQSSFRDADFTIPVPTMNLGAIHGGDNPNRICASCELSMDIRLLPEMSVTKIKASLHEEVCRVIDGSGLEVRFDGNFDGIAGMQTRDDAEIVELAARLTGQAPVTVAFGTEGPFLNAMGMQTVILGPGDIDVAHQANEYVPVARLQPMQDILAGMIDHFCIQAS